MQRRSAGFTLAEVMIVLCIVAVVGALAAPRLDGMLSRMRVRAAANRVAGDIALVRMFAVRNGQTAVLVLERSPACPVRFRGRVGGFRYRVATRAGAGTRVVDLRLSGGRVCMEMNGTDTLAVNSRGIPRAFNNRTVWLHERHYADTLFLSVAGRVRRTW